MTQLFTTDHCPRLYGEDKPSVPDDLPPGQSGDFIRSFDNRLWLFERRWIPKSIKATLTILHGTVDHSGAYHELALELNKTGIAVFASDLRGWGLSDGEAYYIHDMDVFVSDVEDQYDRIQREFPQVKYHFLLGKSIGGLIAAHACCSPKVQFDGLIGLSGAFAIDSSMIPPGPVMTLLHTLNMVMPKLPLKSLMSSSLLVSDEMAQDEWEKDPLVRRERLTVGYLHELLQCSRQLQETLDEKFPSNINMLMLWGEDDTVVTRQGHELMCTYSSNNATFKTYPNGRHNLLQEPTLKQQVIHDIRDWIVENCK